MMRGALRYDQMQAEAHARLRGTIWANSSIAHMVYRVCLIAGAPLGRSGVSANAITIVAVLFAAVAGGFAAFGEFAIAAGFIVLSGLCDLIDGVVARTTGTVSRFGALLDSTMDRFADGFPLLGLVVAFSGSKWTVAIPALAMVVSFIVPYVRARAEGLGVTLPPLFMRRAERIILLVLSLLCGELTIGSVRAPLLLAGLTVLTALSAVGAIHALRSAYQLLRPTAYEKGRARVNAGAATAPSRP